MLFFVFVQVYCCGKDDCKRPFTSEEERDRFSLLCLRMLVSHLSLAQAASVSSQNILEGEARSLRELLFR